MLEAISDRNPAAEVASLKVRWAECVAAILAEDGYLVVGCAQPHAVGDVLDDKFETGNAWQIDEVATWGDSLRQSAIYERVLGGSLGVMPPEENWFYKARPRCN